MRACIAPEIQPSISFAKEKNEPDLPVPDCGAVRSLMASPRRWMNAQSFGDQYREARREAMRQATPVNWRRRGVSGVGGPVKAASIYWAVIEPNADAVIPNPRRSHTEAPPAARMAVLDAVQFAQCDTKHAERAGSAPEH
jgi:hypothetical protein